MASLACQRPSAACIGSALARICDEPFDAGSSTVATILEQQECSSPWIWSCCAVNDRNGVLLENVSGAAGFEGRQLTSSAQEGGASVCAFQEIAQPLSSKGVLKNHDDSSAAQWPEVFKRTQAVGGDATTLNDPQAVEDDTALTTSLSLFSNSDEEEVSSCLSSESLSGARPPRQHVEGTLDSLDALRELLPVKRGLSRYFAGKSQSFTCVGDVRSVADLAKPLTHL